jgi:glycosyltransferase involved in cell wall biosynthesis
VEDGRTGCLVPFGNVEALAEAIIHLLRHPDTAQATGQRAREMVAARFSVQKMVSDYESLYEETLRQNGQYLAGPSEASELAGT